MLVLCVVQRFGSGKVQNYVFLFYGTVLALCLAYTGILLSVGFFADFIIRWIRMKRIRIPDPKPWCGHNNNNDISTHCFDDHHYYSHFIKNHHFIISLFFLLSQNAFFIFTYTFFCYDFTKHTMFIVYISLFFNES